MKEDVPVDANRGKLTQVCQQRTKQALWQKALLEIKEWLCNVKASVAFTRLPGFYQEDITILN